MRLYQRSRKRNAALALALLFASPLRPGLDDQAVAQKIEAPVNNAAEAGKQPCAPGTPERALSEYRAGLVELHGADSIQNKYAIAQLTWKLRCAAGDTRRIEALGSINWAGRAHFELQVTYRILGGQVVLAAISISPVVSHDPPAKQRFMLTGFELRANEQRRGQPIREGAISAPGAHATFQMDETQPDAISALLRATLNNQWLDVPARLGDKPYLLSFELPDPVAVADYFSPISAR